MPTYEYQCDGCNRVFEVRQRISEPPLTTCDACGGTVRRLLSASPFILKGAGWYVTDYPSESRKKAMSAEKSAAGTSSDKAGSSEKSDQSDKSSAATAKSDGAGSTSTSDASSTASKPVD
ncbi:MAG TPA: zinc ribbon domain-containing protein [Methylomirabilota bacterium]|nr:zinc ribbon domain-containing protein [Methylomirabilota bacterium]